MNDSITLYVIASRSPKADALAVILTIAALVDLALPRPDH